jgi:flagellar basal body-associated protein FliL
VPSSYVDNKNLDQPLITGDVTSQSKEKSSTGIIIAVIFFILIGGAVAYFIYNKNKSANLKKGVKKDLKEKGKHCKKCGKLLSPRNKFCTGCGRRI